MSTRVLGSSAKSSTARAWFNSMLLRNGRPIESDSVRQKDIDPPRVSEFPLGVKGDIKISESYPVRRKFSGGSITFLSRGKKCLN